ncbi:hypothetical protein [Nocardia harenae]|uniref:hypothetical protein n=1 Tax=Nocardia harenae TaxID=358707 RepID=UPI00082B6FCA|nr:hypothetical protein [Nocardia harenae]
MTDPTMTAILAAVGTGRDGDTATARTALLELWAGIGPAGDPLHRCTLAHYLADLYDDPAESLAWNIRALDAADTVTDDRVRDVHESLHIAGFYPSLHLNLADDYRRLGSLTPAAEHLALARQHAPALGPDPYGDLIRGAIDGVGAAIASGDTAPRG